MGIESPGHLLFIAVVALLVLGPKRLPALARALGQGIREFRGALEEAAAPEETDKPAETAPQPAQGAAQPAAQSGHAAAEPAQAAAEPAHAAAELPRRPS
jgi:TatA/E family protein of Tat protein translocase